MNAKHRRVLVALLDRVAEPVEDPEAVFLFDETMTWPAGATAALTEAGLLRDMQPSEMITCRGCEEHCRRPVAFDVAAGAPTASWTCNQSIGLGPFVGSVEPLRRWGTNRSLVAKFVGRHLSLAIRDHDPQWRRIRYRTLKLDGLRRAISLECNDEVRFKAGAASVPLIDLFEWSGPKIALDREAVGALLAASDDQFAGNKRVQPSTAVRVAGRNSIVQRDRRLQARIEELAREHPTLNKERLAAKLARTRDGEGLTPGLIARVTRMPKKLGRKKFS